MLSTLLAVILIISGRTGLPLYRMELPDGWNVEHGTPTEDTKKPLVTLTKQGTTVTIHNFPGISIPPTAQVARWQRQSGTGYVEAVSQSGYYGLYYNGEDTQAWAFSLDPELKQNLQLPGSITERQYFAEMASDVTLKAVGPFPKKLVKSFELIQELP